MGSIEEKLIVVPFAIAKTLIRSSGPRWGSMGWKDRIGGTSLAAGLADRISVAAELLIAKNARIWVRKTLGRHMDETGEEYERANYTAEAA